MTGGVSYGLVLIVLAMFVPVGLLNNVNVSKSSDVVLNSFAESSNTLLNFEYNTTYFPHSDLLMDAKKCDLCDFVSNFSMLHFQVSITARMNETVRNPIVELLIESQAGYVVGVGSTLTDPMPFWQPTPSGNRDFSSVIPVVIIFGYDVPSVLRGQVLQIHVQLFEDGWRLLVWATTFTVKTFPNFIDIPRVLLFFFSFGTLPALPANTFIPTRYRKKLETFLLHHHGVLLIVMVALLLISGIYWNYVCKVYCFI